MEKTKKIINRIEYLDLLRILGIFFVIMIHSPGPGQFWYKLSIHSFEWKVLNFYDSMSRWAVPIFVMISGALILSKEYSIKKIYKKISRILLAFLFWSIIYAITFNTNYKSLLFVKNILTGNYHMWFLFMIIGLYMLSPLLKKITESDKLTKYFLIISFTLSSVIPQIASSLLLIDNKYIHIISSAITSNLNNINLYLGYTGYFVLGYYLSNTNISKKWRYIIYCLGIIGFLLTMILTNFASTLSHSPNETYYEFLTINVALETLAIFVFAKYNFKTNKLLKYLSSLCFGIYLSHLLILYEMYWIWDISVISINPVLSVPLITCITFLMALLLTIIISKIPILKKYII